MTGLIRTTALWLVALFIAVGATETQGGQQQQQQPGQNVMRFIKDFMKLQHSLEEKNFDSLELAGLDQNSNETDEKFHQFIAQYNRPYSLDSNLEEYLVRRAIFSRNLIRIALLNYFEQGTAVYDVNEFADMNELEFITTKLGYRRHQRPQMMLNESIAESSTDFAKLWQELLDEEGGKTEEELMSEAPMEFDWRHKEGVVSSVKDQGQCGSCWAFSATGNIEGQMKLRRNVTVSLSEEELVDCDTVDQGCNGGLPQQAFDQVIKLGGLETESDYPYDPKLSKNGCKMAKSARKYTITSFVNLPQDEEKLKVWLTKRGPISIGVNAYAMQWYRHGVSHPWKLFCSPLELDHAVLIVGYGVEHNQKNPKKAPKPYWIIKNSWGLKWGERGYYRLFRGKNVCGVAEDCSSAVMSH